jgi:AraC family transcriptional regulator
MSDDVGPVRFEDGGPMLLGGVRRRHDFADAEAGIAGQWRELEALGDMPGWLGPRRYGVMCGHDATGFEYMCAVEVESLEHLAPGTGRMRVPAQRYAVFAHHGPPSTLRSTWEQALEWLDRGAYDSAHAPDFERYQPGSAAIEVWVGVVPRTVR